MPLGDADKQTLDRLLARHPWYTRQSEVWRWPLLRAAQDGWADPEVRAFYLPPTAAETITGDSGQAPTSSSVSDPLALQAGSQLSSRYVARLQQTPGLSALGGISDRFGATLLQQPPQVQFEDDALKDWADNVDGSGTSLDELMSDVMMEAIVMGRAGVWIDRPATPEGATVENQEDQDTLGILKPRARLVFTEEVTDWKHAEDGVLEWVKLEFQFSRRATALDPLEQVVRWIVIDRTSVRTFEAIVDPDRYSVREPTSETSSPLAGFPGPTEIADAVESLEDLGQVEHGLNRVPFVFAVAKRSSASDPAQTTSILAGTSRADLAALQEDSHAAYSRSLHASPLLAVWTRAKIAEVFRHAGHALHFKPGAQGEEGEDIRYVTTDAQAMDVQMRAVESRRLEAFREAGAEPTGFFSESSGATPESGRAKAIRYGTGEGRILAQLAKRAEATQTEILEVVARWMKPGESAPTAAMVFAGSVEYPQTFDLTPEDELIDQYQTMKGSIPSPTWEETMQKRIASATVGQVPPDIRDAIEEEITQVWEAKREAALAAASNPPPTPPPGPPPPPGGPNGPQTPADDEAALQGAQDDASRQVDRALQS